MRELLFRGKKVKPSVFDETDWVYGSLIDSGNHEQVAIYPWYDGASTMSVRQLVYTRMEGVKPETVGQYTGLTDKNGKRIFEGDMLKPFDDEIDKMVVEFHHGSFLLCLYGERGYMGEGGWVEEGNYGVFECEPLSSYGDDVEVIGNVHDNPELLEVSK